MAGLFQFVVCNSEVEEGRQKLFRAVCACAHSTADPEDLDKIWPQYLILQEGDPIIHIDFETKPGQARVRIAHWAFNLYASTLPAYIAGKLARRGEANLLHKAEEDGDAEKRDAIIKKVIKRYPYKIVLVSVESFGIAPLEALKKRAEEDHEMGLLKGAGKGKKGKRGGDQQEENFDEWTDRMLGPSENSRKGRGKGKARGGGRSRGRGKGDSGGNQESQSFSASDWAAAAGLDGDGDTAATGAPEAAAGEAPDGKK